MRKLFFTILLLIILFPIHSYAQTPCAQTTNAKTANNQQKTPDLVNLLFVLTAKNAVIKATKTGSYTLTFFGVNPFITFFTNRPNRNPGLAPVANFIKAWDVGSNNFKSNPPNALITAVKINNLENSNQQFYLFTLTSPRYNIKQEAMQFTAQPLAQQKIIFKDIRFDNVTMVID